MQYGVRQLFMGDGYSSPYHQFQPVKGNNRHNTTRLFCKWRYPLAYNAEDPYIVVCIKSKFKFNSIYASNNSYDIITKDCKITYWEF